jgi:Protein of unknown function (DUF3293)
MQNPPEAYIATLPAIYLAADYKWELHGQWLPLRIGEPAPALDDAYPSARRFGMMTAANPAHIARSEAENRSADRALQRALDARGLTYRPAFAAAHSRIWKAYNWLVIDPEVDTFTGLGREFGQIGTLLWSRGQPVRLRMYARRPGTLAPHPHIDWLGGDPEAKPGPSP